MEAAVSDLQHRLANLIRVGKVTAVDYAKARVRIAWGANQSAWVPWMTGRAGATKDWNPPAVGEQVAMISPSGTLGAGFILPGGINYADKAAPGSDGDTTKIIFADGSFVEQNAATKGLTASVPVGGTLTLTCGQSSIAIQDGQITITTPNLVLAAGAISAASNGGGATTATFTGDIIQTGKIESTGDHKAGTISLKTHVHGGVQSGGGNTAGPQ